MLTEKTAGGESGEATIIVDRFQQFATQDVTGKQSNYLGLRIHTLPGLHERVAELVEEYVGSGGAAVDLGAGSGALISRLSDMGFAPTAVDYVAENFRLQDSVKFFRADLNGPFAAAVGEQFELVTAVEIIEHLENPRHFLREALKLCKPGKGRIILTTPNTDNPISKAMFCRFGTHMWFSDEDYAAQGHITPLSRWQIHKIADEAGLDVLHEESFGDPFLRLGRWPKMRLFARLIERVSVGAAKFRGEVYVAVLAPRT